MDALRIRELEHSDVDALLAFETLNRPWFESHIDPRPSSFYSPHGVQQHIEHYLKGFAEGVWHPFVIEDGEGNGERHIVGRANLKDINTAKGLAEVGYRIAQDACGRGLATRALRHLIEQAQRRWGLEQLVAYAYHTNAGSQRVLTRCGFVADPVNCEPGTSDAQPPRELRFTLRLRSVESAR